MNHIRKVCTFAKYGDVWINMVGMTTFQTFQKLRWIHRNTGRLSLAKNNVFHINFWDFKDYHSNHINPDIFKLGRHECWSVLFAAEDSTLILAWLSVTHAQTSADKITSILQRFYRIHGSCTEIMFGSSQRHHRHGIFQLTTPWGYCSGSFAVGEASCSAFSFCCWWIAIPISVRKYSLLSRWDD